MFETISTLAQLLGQGAVIGAHLVSLHGSPTYDCTPRDAAGTALYQARECAYQNLNPGAYVRLANGATFGAYRNSYGDASAYAGWTWQTEGGAFALTAGAVAGYRGSPIAPLVAPSMRLDLSEVAAPGWALRVSLIPKPPRHHSATAVLHLSLEASL
jgi:hypothetical protein